MSALVDTSTIAFLTGYCFPNLQTVLFCKLPYSSQTALFFETALFYKLPYSSNCLLPYKLPFALQTALCLANCPLCYKLSFSFQTAPCVTNCPLPCKLNCYCFPNYYCFPQLPFPAIASILHPPFASMHGKPYTISLPQPFPTLSSAQTIYILPPNYHNQLNHPPSTSI